MSEIWFQENPGTAYFRPLSQNKLVYFLEFPVCHQAKIHPSIFITTIFWFYGDMRNIEKKKKKKETEKKISWTIFNAKRLHWIWLKHWAKFQRWSVCFTLSRLPYPFLHKMLMSNRATWKSELWGVHKFGLVSSRLKKKKLQIGSYSSADVWNCINGFICNTNSLYLRFWAMTLYLIALSNN